MFFRFGGPIVIFDDVLVDLFSMDICVGLDIDRLPVHVQDPPLNMSVLIFVIWVSGVH